MSKIVQARFRRLIDLIYQTFQLLGYNNTQRNDSLRKYALDPVDWDNIKNLPLIVEVARMLMSEYYENKETFSQLLHSLEPVLKKLMEEPNFDLEIFTEKNYLNLTNVPDDFYRDLQDQINRAYRAGILTAVQILSRKFLENLIVDILRRKFGRSEGYLDLFYDRNHRQHLSFRKLLENLENKFDDFIGVSDGFNSGLIGKIKEFKEQANSSAHTLELNLTREAVDDVAGDLEQIIKVLIRVLNAL